MGIRLGISLLFSFIAQSAFSAGAGCDRPLVSGAFGVHVDYRSGSQVDQDRIALVERFHFTPDVEALIKGQSSTIPSDIDYTLRQIPNHYRALDTMARWQLKFPHKESDKDYSNITCYFERAFDLFPNDPMLQFVFGVSQHRNKDFKEALRAYTKAEELGLTSAELYYNFGLVYVDLGDKEKAVHYAEKAYALGYKPPGLNIKIKKMSPGAQQNSPGSPR